MFGITVSKKKMNNAKNNPQLMLLREILEVKNRGQFHTEYLQTALQGITKCREGWGRWEGKGERWKDSMGCAM